MATSLIVITCSAVIVSTLYRFLRSLPRRVRAYVAMCAPWGGVVGAGVIATATTGDPAAGAFYAWMASFLAAALTGCIAIGMNDRVEQ